MNWIFRPMTDKVYAYIRDSDSPDVSTDTQTLPTLHQFPNIDNPQIPNKEAATNQRPGNVLINWITLHLLPI